MNDDERDDEVAVTTLASLLEVEFGWAIDAGWEATARSMLRKVRAATEGEEPS